MDRNRYLKPVQQHQESQAGIQTKYQSEHQRSDIKDVNGRPTLQNILVKSYAASNFRTTYRPWAIKT